MLDPLLEVARHRFLCVESLGKGCSGIGTENGFTMSLVAVSTYWPFPKTTVSPDAEKLKVACHCSGPTLVSDAVCILLPKRQRQDLIRQCKLALLSFFVAK